MSLCSQSKSNRTIYMNLDASSYSLSYSEADYKSLAAAQRFHKHHLPSFKRTPLVPLDELARKLGVKKVFVKDESSRLGLPAFKILGASWGTCRAVAARVGLVFNDDNDYTLESLSKGAREHGIKLFAATEGNHGRAVARMAALFQVPAEIFVPNSTHIETQKLIASEKGVSVTIVQGDYDMAVSAASHEAAATDGGVLVQDNSFAGYEEIPEWIIEGYSTMFYEIETQLSHQNLYPSLIITPVGVGSLAQAVVTYCKSQKRQNISVLAVEPDTAACLYASLKAGSASNPVSTSHTIMAGMNCGTVSPTAWPILQRGVDASITVSDAESHAAVQYLHGHGINAGPCGAATLAALHRVVEENPSLVGGLGADSVLVLLSTEGAREYAIPTP